MGTKLCSFSKNMKVKFGNKRSNFVSLSRIFGYNKSKISVILKRSSLTLNKQAERYEGRVLVILGKDGH